MKKLISLTLAAALLLALGAAAYADIANEHIDDFYWRNTGKFDYTVSGLYYVDSPDGYVTAWTSPAALKFVENLPNGKLVYIQAAYKGWATCTYLADGKYVDGNEWMPLNCLTRKYSAEDFAAEYSAEIDRSGSSSDFFSDYVLKDRLYFYTYPDSGEVCNTIEAFVDGEPLIIDAVYTSPTGEKWGYCQYYYYQNVEGWICLSAPESPSLPALNDRTARQKAPPTAISADLKKLRYDYIISGALYAAAAAAGVAVIAASVLIYKARKKRMSGTQVPPQQ